MNSPTSEYVYAGSRMVATLDGAGTPTYSHQDHLSTRVQTDSSGNLLRTFGHQPFGESWYSSGVSDKWKFTTYDRDSESGLDYAIFRFDAPGLGRFMSPDPILGNLTSPQSHNRYGYSLNDPVNRIDPLGLTSCTFEGIPVPCSQIPWSVARRAVGPRAVYDVDGELLGICIVRFHAGGGSTCQFGGESFRDSDLDLLCTPGVLNDMQFASDNRNMTDDQGNKGEISFSIGQAPYGNRHYISNAPAWQAGTCLANGNIQTYANILPSVFGLDAVIHSHPDRACGGPIDPNVSTADQQFAVTNQTRIYVVTPTGVFGAGPNTVVGSVGRRVGSIDRIRRACAARGGG